LYSLPLLAAIVAGTGAEFIGKTAAKVITTGGLFLACALSWPIFVGFLTGNEKAYVEPVMQWVQSGALKFDWELRVDALTAVMLVVITTVSALVHLYSWGYMEEDPDQPRFFAYLSLFTFAMLMLVTANNLVQMFFGWEGVGLASYLLIGFWYKKPSANAAAIKAFVVNRVGDLGFMLGIFGVFWLFGTVSIPDILAAAPGKAGSSIGFLGYARRYDEPALHPVVHRCDGQVGTAWPAHMAARRDGGADTGFGTDPRGNDGDRRRVHGLPPVAAV
jgi:NADH-quinone oxidoreductase subunit L